MNQPCTHKTSFSKHRNAFIGLLAGIVVAGVSLTSTVRADNPAPAPAPAAGPTKVAVVDLRKAYVKMQETVASNSQITGMQGELETKVKVHKIELEDAQKAIANVKPGSPEHTKMMEDLDQKGLQFDVEEKQMQLKMIHQRARQMKQALDEITAAATAIAKQKGFDIVLVNNSTELPDNIADMGNQDQLVNLIFARNFLYVSPSNDITDLVIAKVDADFKAGAPATTPPTH